ncbi:MAG: 2OG-Fe(II) oxygenase family protein [Thermaceae bacterium]|nr:2OG-Fe(II) oxygenase family protein [Thermaceae bacterium]
MNPAVQLLWPTPILVKRFEHSEAVNAELVRLFYQELEAQGGMRGNVYSSRDDLLERYSSPALQALFGFVSSSVFEVAQAMNAPLWKRLGTGKLQMHVVGAWFQIQNRYGFHDIHNHGNCSWSGVYYVQIDPVGQRRQHPALGVLNGITRFYSQGLNLLGGAHMDMGNAYMQQSTFDVTPEEGVLVVFPSWLLHKAMPYDGEKDRIILSFNAQIHAEGGNKGLEYDFH